MKNSALRISGLNIRFTLAIILLTVSSFAQTFSDSLVAVLKKKNLTETEAFLTNSKHMNVRPVLYRQILDNYFEYSFEARTSPGYKICFLSDGDKIIYAKVLSAKKKYFEEQDSTSIKHFYKNYTAFFETKIKLSDFFVDTIQYGRGCGFAGVDPPLRKKLKTVVATNNTKELSKWLQSPVTEKQLYGVEGFMELEKKGYNLSPFQKKLIDFIKTKKGKARTCDGCIYSDKEIILLFKSGG